MSKLILIDPDELRMIIAEEVGAAIRKAGTADQRHVENVCRFDNLSLHAAIEYLRELGYITTVKSLYGRTSAGTIPCRKVGRRLIFSRKELAEWVAGQTSTQTTRAARRANAAARLANCVIHKTAKV